MGPSVTLAARRCPSCGVVCEGVSGGSIQEILGGGIGAAVRLALQDTLDTGGIPDLISELLSSVAEYRGSPGASECCPVCELIHAGESLIHRHRRCLLHASSGKAYRSVKIGQTVHVRGNESMVGMAYGATRANPEGDLKRLEILTGAAAAGVARAVTAKAGDLYDRQDPQTDASLLADLMLKSDHLVWNLRRELEAAAAGASGPLPVESRHIDIPIPLIPPAATAPALPALPDVPANVPPASHARTLENLHRRRPPVVPGGTSLASSVGCLKQRILRVETHSELQTVSVALRGLLASPRYPGRTAPDLPGFPNDKLKLYYLVDRLWIACKNRDLAEADFRELLNYCCTIGKTRHSSAQTGSR